MSDDMPRVAGTTCCLGFPTSFVYYPVTEPLPLERLLDGVWPQNHVEFVGRDGYPAGSNLPNGARAMAAAVVRRTDTGFVLQVEVPYRDSMLDAEGAILDALNQAGVAATEEALRRFDADGRPIRLGPMKLTSMGKVRKEYQNLRGHSEYRHLS